VTEGVVLGLAAALCWGITDLIAAIAARRVGTLRAAALGLTTSLVVLVALLAATGSELNLDVGDVVRIAAVGALAAVSTIALWAGLRRGPMTVVSPMAATVGAMTVVLAWLILGEQPRPVQWLAVPAAVVGCILASTTTALGGGRLSLVGRGPLFAAVAVVGFTFVAIGLREPIREIGWLQTIVVARTANSAVVWLALAGTIRWPSLPGAGASEGPRWQGWRLPALVLVAGVLDALGFCAFAFGFEVAPVWLIGLLSSFAPAIGVLGGLLVFGERPARRQWYGAAAIGLAVVCVALG
jgi:drug/metabolite transporter (DMT)-like permease